MEVDIAANLNRIREEIGRAAARAGRDPAEILLVGASKGVDPERIGRAIVAGLPALGESYIQEAVPKIAALGHPVPWHFIGRLQRNKAKLAAHRFDIIQTIDSGSLATALDHHAASLGRRLPVLIEVNLAGDPGRPGAPPDGIPALADDVKGHPYLALRGLMGMPPPGCSGKDARPFFQTLKRLADALHNENRQILSMGMTGDFAVAIEEGSTLVRIGTGIFGPRG